MNLNHIQNNFNMTDNCKYSKNCNSEHLCFTCSAFATQIKDPSEGLILVRDSLQRISTEITKKLNITHIDNVPFVDEISVLLSDMIAIRENDIVYISHDGNEISIIKHIDIGKMVGVSKVVRDTLLNMGYLGSIKIETINYQDELKSAECIICMKNRYDCCIDCGHLCMCYEDYSMSSL